MIPFSLTYPMRVFPLLSKGYIIGKMMTCWLAIDQGCFRNQELCSVKMRTLKYNMENQNPAPISFFAMNA